MAYNLMKKYVVSETEKQLRLAVHSVLPDYEGEYRFNNQSGLFVERLLKYLTSHCSDPAKWANRLRTALYITLAGCSSKADGLSIPCLIRNEIEIKITEATIASHEKAQAIG